VLACKTVPLAQASNFAAVFTATYIGGTMVSVLALGPAPLLHARVQHALRARASPS
jgi:hypothetical protein